MDEPIYDDGDVIYDEVEDEYDEEYEAEEGALDEDEVEKETNFEEDEEELEEDDVDEDDIGQYEEILTEVKEVAANKNPYKTGKFLYKYELPRIISSRAAQIQGGAPPLIKLVDPKDPTRILKDPLEIAEEELRQGKLPLMVERPLPSKVPHKPIIEQRPLGTLIYALD